MYSEVICINLLLNHWVKLGAIKSAKGSIQCLVNERIHKGWIICIQTHYELVVKTKMIIILHTIFSPCSRGMLMGVSLQGCSVVLFAVAVQPLISVTNMNWKGRAISVPHTRSVADRDFPAFLSCYLCNAHILLLQKIWMTHQQDLEPAWAKQWSWQVVLCRQIQVWNEIQILQVIFISIDGYGSKGKCGCPGFNFSRPKPHTLVMFPSLPLKQSLVFSLKEFFWTYRSLSEIHWVTKNRHWVPAVSFPSQENRKSY